VSSPPGVSAHHLEAVRIRHEVEDVAERIDQCRGDESASPILDWLEDRCSHRRSPFDLGLDIVDMPRYDRT
jgi:hypothetical protein